ncbi:metal-dependent hydrolase [Alienimonas californiensis]|uniref:Inner membrane protein n=1 Tax=Alienimonas californiensis TaxID=2527989 RepID=A0A517PDX9_9PLAN|nr:metal-dependent hydrolase [Alienimonas californiensis]QDT17582.1 hypothetical protein CA12_37100 [Alienimonas californiensis]
MDLFTHLLTGWLLVRGLPDRWRGGDGRLRAVGLWLPTAAILAALLPDVVEVAVGPAPSGDLVRWLWTERGWSHGLCGAAASAGALWIALLPTARGDRGAGHWAAGWSPQRAAAVAFGGVSLHLVWDALTPLGLRPLYPFSSSLWVRSDLVLPGDPWGHLILLSGVGLTLWREELGQWGAWTILAAVSIWRVAVGAVGGLLIGPPPQSVPVPLLAAGVWSVGIIHVLVLRRWRRWPRAPLVAVGLLSGLLAASAAFNVAAGEFACAELRAELERGRAGSPPAQVEPASNPPGSDALPPWNLDVQWLATRPAGLLPWERVTAVSYEIPPGDLPPSGGRFVVLSEIRLQRRRPGWTLDRELRNRGGWYAGDRLIVRAGLSDDGRIRALRGWCRFPHTAPYLWEERMPLDDGPFLEPHPVRRRPIFRLAVPPEPAAELRAEWQALESQ